MAIVATLISVTRKHEDLSTICTNLYDCTRRLCVARSKREKYQVIDSIVSKMRTNVRHQPSMIELHA